MVPLHRLAALLVVCSLLGCTGGDKNAAPDITSQMALIVLVAGGVSIFSGLGLLVAGVLALMGRADYKAYRRGITRRDSQDD